MNRNASMTLSAKSSFLNLNDTVNIDEIGLHAQYLDTILGSMVSTSGKAYMIT